MNHLIKPFKDVILRQLKTGAKDLVALSEACGVWVGHVQMLQALHELREERQIKPDKNGGFVL